MLINRFGVDILISVCCIWAGVSAAWIPAHLQGELQEVDAWYGP